ncbi:hypothetical protein PD5205_02449 [Xanthomonas fragariae]|uniref:Uncharacterized protein n=1 Tax=Xanthomonas fragariae TaxID=48664 RepID=A0A1Y6GY20_9XANT|nr:hypothetical protein NBC2815_02448 [Xanthomonas fragariae]SMQ99718.1 hypothetical protein PD885_02486 [Xanthomonas fragariae]SMR03740.1 hypothetical protein PD5205_02449 [Xanthomonas fragariae]
MPPLGCHDDFGLITFWISPLPRKINFLWPQ